MTYFDAKHLPDSQNEYVCWLDIMGTQSIMSNSIKISANFIFKLHAALLSNKLEDLKLYPVMDGVYITSNSKETITKYLSLVFKELADNFIDETNPIHKFIVKASLSYGPIIHGHSLPSEANRIFEQHTNYKNSLLLGLPMVQAFKSEDEAPPFGVFVHETARAFSPDSDFQLRLWQWFRYIPEMAKTQKNEFAKRLLKSLEDYYIWVSNHSFQLGYKRERIEVHRERFKEYFRVD